MSGKWITGCGECLHEPVLEFKITICGFAPGQTPTPPPSRPDDEIVLWSPPGHTHEADGVLLLCGRCRVIYFEGKLP